MCRGAVSKFGVVQSAGVNKQRDQYFPDCVAGCGRRYPEPKYDCRGECVEPEDRCGVCGGDNSTCGCTDSFSCNYNPTATNDDGSCRFVSVTNCAKQFFILFCFICCSAKSEVSKLR